jgi:hypothetical protein
MMRHTLLALALLAAPAIVVAQQPSPMQGQAPAADTLSKPKATKATKGKKAGTHKMGKKSKPMAKPAAKDTSKAKP